jgi:hypothetical protein
MTNGEQQILEAMANQRTVTAPESNFGDTGFFSGNYTRALEFAHRHGLRMLEDHPNATYIFTRP